MEVLYLCDGTKCPTAACENSPCQHTTNIKYAANFKEEAPDVFVEQPREDSEE